MPTELLLPAFGLTLLANALLVAMAIRALRRSRRDRADAESRRRSGRANSVAGGHFGTEPIDRAAGAPDVRARAIEEAQSEAEAAQGSPEVGHAAATAEALDPSPPRPKQRPRAAASKARPPGAAMPGRGRRKFSLPPLDEDHEKVRRSIESFLSSGGEPEGAAADHGAGVDRPADASRDKAAGPTTVALIAVDGPAEDDDERALEMIERTLRGSARGTDAVVAAERGRYRIVLAATGELAARAYLRRVRATVEPVLETGARPLRLRIATATVLDEPLHVAFERAQRRLEALPAATRGSAEGDSDGEPEPRVAATDR